MCARARPGPRYCREQAQRCGITSWTGAGGVNALTACNMHASRQRRLPSIVKSDGDRNASAPFSMRARRCDPAKALARPAGHGPQAEAELTALARPPGRSSARSDYQSADAPVVILSDVGSVHCAVCCVSLACGGRLLREPLAACSTPSSLVPVDPRITPGEAMLARLCNHGVDTAA